MTSAIPVRCSTNWAMKPRWKQVIWRMRWCVYDKEFESLVWIPLEPHNCCYCVTVRITFTCIIWLCCGSWLKLKIKDYTGKSRPSKCANPQSQTPEYCEALKTVSFRRFSDGWTSPSSYHTKHNTFKFQEWNNRLFNICTLKSMAPRDSFGQWFRILAHFCAQLSSGIKWAATSVINIHC